MHERHRGTCARSLRLIGEFELRCDGEAVELPPTAQRLVGLLALNGGRQVRRTSVSGTLWPDTTDQHASARLRTAIWRTPGEGGTSLVGASATHLWLRPEITVDLQRATARARHLLSVRSPDESVCDETLEPFTDDLLVGWDDHWVVVDRERFRQLRLHVLDRLGELLVGARRYGEAVEVGLAAVAAEPLRETAQRLVVHAHLCEGNVAEAMRQYRSYADLLGRELHVRPSAAMEDLMATALPAAARRAWSQAAPVPHQQPGGSQPKTAAFARINR